MNGEKYSEELKANIILDFEKSSLDMEKIARKFGLECSSVKAIIQEYQEAKNEVSSLGDELFLEFQGIEIDDKDFKSAEEKIAFYKAEAEKYKKLSREIEKRENISSKDKKILFAKEVEKIINVRSLCCAKSRERDTPPEASFPNRKL